MKTIVITMLFAVFALNLKAQRLALGVGMPDLVVSEVSITAITEDTISYKFTIKNVAECLPGANCRATGKFWMHAYTALIPTGQDRPAGSRVLSLNLAVGESIEKHFSWHRKPVAGAFAGQDILGDERKFLVVCIDTQDEIIERNSNNNCRAVSLY